MMKKILFLLASLLVLGCSKDDEGGVTSPVDPSAEKVPVAVNDQYTTTENNSLVVKGLLDNDTVYEYARVASVDSETSKGGTVVDNRDGTYTYAPPTDFLGEDTFEYTMCDNSSPKKCSTATVTIEVTEASFEAREDAYETEEEKMLVISSYLDNDNLPTNAFVRSVGIEGTQGNVELQNDGKIIYTPAEGFVGEDSFTYTVCDDDEDPCKTATISVTVVDEGTPVAVNDVVSMAAGQTELIIDILANDDLTDDAEPVSVQSVSHGSVVLNTDGTVTYIAEAGYVGESSFTYTLCDDDTEPSCVNGEVTVKIVETISFNIPSDLDYYYSDAVFSNDKDVLYQELSIHTKENHVNKLEYYMRHDYLYDADEDPNNPTNVILMYSGESRPEDQYWEGYERDEWETFNTEHIYPQSKLGDNEEAKNDMHHMRSADIVLNETRSNYPFTEGSGDYELINGNSWYPGDEWKGDVARMVMYINLKYGEPFSDVGSREMFLKWNVEDPVSPFELQRQEVIEGAQGNRNPFIDNPYLATLIWGGDSAENKWQ